MIVDTFMATQSVAVATNAASAALLVFCILRGTRFLGGRAIGLISGLPLTSGPAMLLLALEQSTNQIVSLAASVMISSSAFAFFAVFFVVLRGKAHVALSLAVAAIGSIATVLIAHRVDAVAAPIVGTLPVCAALLATAYHLLHRATRQRQALAPKASELAPAAAPSDGARSMRYDAAAALVTAANVLVLAWLGASAPVWLSAVIVCLPLISATTLVVTTRDASEHAAVSVATGFIFGCLTRACFAFFVAALLPTYGVLTGFTAATVATLALTLVLLYRPRTTETPAPIAPIADRSAATRTIRRNENEVTVIRVAG